VLDFLIEEINKIDGTLLVVLDEVDGLDDDTLLYRLSRAREDGYVEDTYLGVIGISNDLKYRDSLRSKVRSSLCEKTILFPPYDAAQLRKVLDQRIETAFQSGVVDGSATAACAAYGSRNGGDARLALDLLRQSGDLARSEEDVTVTNEHVERAQKKIERDRVIDTVQDYSQHGKYTLLSLLQLEQEGETPCRSRVVQRRYNRLCNEEGMEPVSDRAIRDYLAELDSLGIISSSGNVEHNSGGKFNTHTVVGDVVEMKDALTDSLG
jgi:cell division control protein 6